MKGLSRYAAVGLVATVGHYALLVLLVELTSLPAGPSALAGSILGALVAYLGNRRYTFSHAGTPHGRALPRFAAIAGMGALANALIVGGGAALGVHYLLMQVLATVLVMLATYHLNRLWTFGSSH
ncbi:MAG: GtrA family protein [Betaproteobacteria bacterium]|nr:GtrA family protein [Betaproteobacteria bacterium]